jgi:DNA-binding NtrC family response regulator
MGPSVSGAEMRILIVDDDPGILNAFRIGLRSAGHQSATAGNGRHALDLIESSMKSGMPFDLLVTDLRMPKMDGLSLIRQSKEICPGLQCILMTAYGDEDLAKKVLALGRCGYLEKPFSPAKLNSVIEEMWAHLDCLGQERSNATA